MKALCVVDKLKQKTNLLVRITGKNQTLPVLNTILIEAKKQGITIKATNLEVGAELQIQAKVEKEGVCAVFGNVLQNFLAALQNDDVVTIELIKNTLSLSTKNTTTLIKTIPHEDFPNIPKIKGDTKKIQTKQLIDGIKSVWFSASTSDIKPEIASIYLYTTGGNLFFVATDSFRLTEKKVPVKNFEVEGILIPYKNALEVVRFFEETTESIDVLFDKNQAVFQTKEIYLTTRLTDGVYPDYKQIIPKNFRTQVVLLKKDLGDALKIANIFSDEFSRVVLRIITEDNRMEMESKNTNIGENVTKIDAHLEGASLETSFNHKYITDVLPIITTDSVSLRFNEPNKPIVITGVGDESTTYLVMPTNR
jgi:DNA polymerase-3 subunit beta